MDQMHVTTDDRIFGDDIAAKPYKAWADRDFWLPFREMCSEIDLDSGVVQVDQILDEFSNDSNLGLRELEVLLNELRNRLNNN
jgi:hypothetical protein